MKNGQKGGAQMTHIDELRKSIDAIDDQLVELLEKRMGIVRQVAEFKNITV